MIAINIYCIISFLFKVPLLSANIKIPFIASAIGIIMMGFIIYKIQIVYIDTINKMIIVKRFITKKTTIYRFNEVDGFYDVAITHTTRRIYYSKAIAITKNKKIIVLIDSHYCSNYKEIRENLYNLNYLGADKNWIKNNF